MSLKLIWEHAVCISDQSLDPVTHLCASNGRKMSQSWKQGTLEYRNKLSYTDELYMYESISIVTRISIFYMSIMIRIMLVSRNINETIPFHYNCLCCSPPFLQADRFFNQEDTGPDFRVSRESLAVLLNLLNQDQRHGWGATIETLVCGLVSGASYRVVSGVFGKPCSTAHCTDTQSTLLQGIWFSQMDGTHASNVHSPGL